MTHDLRSMPWTAICAAILGIVVSWLFSWSVVQQAYDNVRPVLVLSVSIIERTADSVTLRLTGEKKRDCTLKSIHALTRNGLPMRDASIVRTDKPQNTETETTGSHDFGIWMVWPTDGASSVVVYVKHDCDGRAVFVSAPEIKL